MKNQDELMYQLKKQIEITNKLLSFLYKRYGIKFPPKELSNQQGVD